MKIGLTYTGDAEKHQNYKRWLKGDEEVSITRLSAADNNLDSIKHCDAIVLSGGKDIHPKYYKNKKTSYPEKTGSFDKKRDEFEIAVFKSAQRNNIPVLGVCRGLQLINCILGGNLKQDLGKALNKIHRFEINDKAHGLNIEPGSLLYEITQIKRGVVNSAHHQGIKTLGDGLQINCRADDGTIEGFEWADKKEKPFMLCVQWHPERMFKLQLGESPLSKAVRNRFMEEIKRSKANKK
jgi:putative glutamine amidotransferase